MIGLESLKGKIRNITNSKNLRSIVSEIINVEADDGIEFEITDISHI